MKNFYFILLFLIIGISLYGQEKCGFDRMYQQAITNPSNLRSVQNFERFVEEYARNPQMRSTGTPTIPVVVHILYTTASAATSNPPDAQINSAIDDLNAAWNRPSGSFYATHSPSYPGVPNIWSTPLNVNFKLAQVAEDGSATTGILRHNMDGDSWAGTYNSDGLSDGGGAGAQPVDVMRKYAWNPVDYMNIWITHKINGGVSILGYATLPNTNPGYSDGLVCLTDAFGRVPGYNTPGDPIVTPAGWILNTFTGLNGTADHEVGHYVSLHHPFNGDMNGTTCPADVTVGTNSDGCADTPPQKRTNSVCPTVTTTGNTDCGGGHNGYVHNFMDYSNDACFYGFSPDQATRASAALAGPRNQLCHSIGDDASVGLYPTTPTTTTPSTTSLDDGSGTSSISLNGTTWTSWIAEYDDGYLNRTASAPTSVINLNTSYSLNVAYTGTNQLEISAWIDYNNDGDFLDANEYLGTVQGLALDTPDPISFTTPASLPAGVSINQRLRLRTKSTFDSTNNVESDNPDTDSDIGQIEDYSVAFSNPLPVEMRTFKAIPKEKEIELVWETASELNNSGFHVQRKTTSGDTWSKIGWVAGVGTSANPNTYRFSDRDVKPNVDYFYRLAQEDFDGTTDVSSVVSAKITSDIKTPLSVVPNPVSNSSIQLQYDAQQLGNLTIHIYSKDGRLVRTLQNEVTQEGINTIEMSVDGIASGLYLISTQLEGTMEYTRLIIMN